MKALGFPQNGLFVWSVDSIHTMRPEVELLSYACSVAGQGVDCTAWTISELAPFIKKHMTKLKGTMWLHPESKYKELVVGDSAAEVADAIFSPDYWAKYLIYLVETKIITL